MKIRMMGTIGAALLLAGCATEKPNGFPQFDRDNTITLGPGQSVILARGQTVKVPFGSAVIQPGPGGSAVILNGQKNTVAAAAGAIVTVPVNAAGPADNLVVSK
jgi:hypothetical protein